MSDLTEFLLARIAEDEAVATAPSLHPHWEPVTDDHGRKGIEHSVWAGDVRGEYVAEYARFRSVVEHIARHDPARVLAECESKRRMIEYATGSFDVWTAAEVAAVEGALEYTLRMLALPYASRPDYREEWRP